MPAAYACMRHICACALDGRVRLCMRTYTYTYISIAAAIAVRSIDGRTAGHGCRVHSF